MNSIDVRLGPWDEMADLFSWDAAAGVDLRDLIAHGLNQTMERDRLLGAWVDVYDSGGGILAAKLTAPFGDVRGYARAIAAFVAAGRVGYAAYMAHRAQILQGKLIFYLPVGLPMLRTQSVQLLHYPPYEARTYSDYLYSPTNRRWEALLGDNDHGIEDVTLLERICDSVPLAGPGSDARGINAVEKYFVPYGKAMLAALLDFGGARTQPVVAYGGPARAWLRSAYPTQVKRAPQLMALLELRLGDGRATTPVLCANHPSEFLFFDKHGAQWAFDIMTNDLIAAGWQARMAADRNADPVKALRDATARWRKDPARVREIVARQKLEFSYAAQSPTTRNPENGDVPGRHAAAQPVTAPSRKPARTR